MNPLLGLGIGAAVALAAARAVAVSKEQDKEQDKDKDQKPRPAPSLPPGQGPRRPQARPLEVVDPSEPVPSPTASPGIVAASNLHAYLKAKGLDKSKALKSLILAFQKAANKDPSINLASPLKEDGVWGPKTAEALADAGYAYNAPPVGPKGINPDYKPQPPPIVNRPDHPRGGATSPPQGKPGLFGTSPNGNPIYVVQPEDPNAAGPSLPSIIQATSAARNEAYTLYDYLMKNGNRPSQDLKTLTLAFQQAHNRDEWARKLEVLSQDGNYGPRTSAMLTIYTGNPIPSTGGVPLDKPSSRGQSTGAAALTASNLYAYLKVHGNDRKPRLKELVLAFQKAVNTDPTFPGPAFPYVDKRVIKTKLSEDGAYGPKTSDALAAASYERIKP